MQPSPTADTPGRSSEFALPGHVSSRGRVLSPFDVDTVLSVGAAVSRARSRGPSGPRSRFRSSGDKPEPAHASSMRSWRSHQEWCRSAPPRSRWRPPASRRQQRLALHELAQQLHHGQGPSRSQVALDRPPARWRCAGASRLRGKPGPPPSRGRPACSCVGGQVPRLIEVTSANGARCAPGATSAMARVKSPVNTTPLASSRSRRSDGVRLPRWARASPLTSAPRSHHRRTPEAEGGASRTSRGPQGPVTSTHTSGPCVANTRARSMNSSTRRVSTRIRGVQHRFSRSAGHSGGACGRW